MVILLRLVACLALPLVAATPMSAAPAGDPPSGSAEAREKGGETEKLPFALEHAAALTGRIVDEDFHSLFKEQLVEFYLAKGFYEPALALAESIPDHRRGIALAKVAVDLAHRDDKERIASLLDRALSQSGFPHPWQADAIRAEVAIAWAAAGHADRAAETAAKIDDQASALRAKAGIALESVRLGKDLDPETFAVPKDPTKIAPELLVLARGAIEIAELQITKSKDASKTVGPLCDQAAAIIRTCKATAGEELLDLGVLWRTIGDLKKSGDLIGRAVQHLAPGSEMQGWRNGYLAKLVRLYVDAGESEKVSAMLAVAREGIARQHPFHQVPGFCQLAEAELVASSSANAEATWTEAVRVALANPNPDSQLLGSAQVLFSLARSGREIPKPIVDSLAALSPSPKVESTAPEK